MDFMNFRKVKDGTGAAFDKIRKNDFIKNVLRVLINGGYLYVLTFINSVLIARTIGPKGQGIVSYVNTLGGMAVHLIGGGLDLADRYYVARNKNDLPGILGNTMALFGLYMAAGGLFFLVTFAFNVTFDISGFLLILLIARVPLETIGLQMQGMLLGLTEVSLYNRSKRITGFLYSMFVFIFWISGVISPVLVLLSAFIAYLASFGMMLFALCKRCAIRMNLNAGLFRSMLPYGFKSYIGVLFNYFLLRSDVLMVDYFMGKYQTGLYSTASSLANILLTLTSSVALLLTTRLIELPSEEARFKFENRIICTVSVLMAFVVLAVTVFSGWAIQVFYGMQYKDSAFVFRVLMPGIFCWGLNSIISSYLAAVNQLNITIVASAAAFFFNLVLNYYLIRRFGIVGAGIASSLAYLTDVAIRGIYYFKLYKGCKK